MPIGGTCSTGSGGSAMMRRSRVWRVVADAHAIGDASAQSASSRQTKRLEPLKEPYGQTSTGSNKGG
jgi:hypothetical protein